MYVECAINPYFRSNLGITQETSAAITLVKDNLYKLTNHMLAFILITYD